MCNLHYPRKINISNYYVMFLFQHVSSHFPIELQNYVKENTSNLLNRGMSSKIEITSDTKMNVALLIVLRPRDAVTAGARNCIRLL